MKKTSLYLVAMTIPGIALALPSAGCSSAGELPAEDDAPLEEPIGSAAAALTICPCFTDTNNACNYSPADRVACGVPSGGCSSMEDWERGYYAHVAACAPPFDALDFMRNSHGGTLVSDDDGSIVSYHELPDGHFYYVKGSSGGANDGHVFERYGFDGTNIWQERDTSWPLVDRGAFDAYDAVSPTTHAYGARVWAKRSVRDGDAWSTSTQIIGFQSGSATQRCRWSNRPVDDRNSTNPETRQIRRYPQIDWGGSIGTVESIAIASGDEVHWYAKGWGWVKWEYNGPPREGVRSPITWTRHISSKKQPLERCPSGPLPFERPTRVGVFRDGGWLLDVNAEGYDPSDRQVWWGAPGDTPVVGSWDGSGQPRLGVARVESNGMMYWYLDVNGNGPDGADRALQFGLSGDVPVVGEWTVTGQSRAGVFRRGTWVFDINGNGFDGADRTVTYGDAGYVPVTGAW
ncbi:hypothetical protein WMF30_41640 [Sorangium sp. So ce134]